MRHTGQRDVAYDHGVVPQRLGAVRIRRTVKAVGPSKTAGQMLRKRPRQMNQERRGHHREHGRAQKQLIVALAEQTQRETHGRQQE